MSKSEPVLCQGNLSLSYRPCSCVGLRWAVRFLMPNLHQGSLLPIQRPPESVSPQCAHSHVFASSRL